MYYLTLFSFLFFSGLVALATWLVVHKKESDTQEGFFLAGRSLTYPFIAGSLLLTNLSTEQLVGLNGQAFNEGFLVFSWEVLATLSLILCAFFFLPRYLRYGVTTIPEYLGKRFGRSTETICNLLFLFSYVFLLLPIILYTGATGINGLFDVHALTGIENDTVLLWGLVIFIGVIGSLYALFGGLRTVAVSDLFNGIGLLIGGVMIFFFALSKAGDGQGMWAGFLNVRNYAPEHFRSWGGASSSIPFSTLFTGVMLINIYYWCTNQQIIQRALAAKSLAEGQKGVLLCGFLKLLGPVYLVLPGIIAAYLFRGQGIKGDHAYGLLVREVLPAPLTGFFAAVMMGAILSSFNSVLNASCTLFCLGPYKQFFNKTASDQQVLYAGKVFGWAVAILSMVSAPFLAKTSSIFAFLQQVNAVFAVPLLAVIMIALFSKCVPVWVANWALFLGIVLKVGTFVFKLQMNAFHASGILFLLLCAGMLILGRCKPDQPKMMVEGPLNLTSWKGCKPVSIALAAIVVLFYVLLM